MFQKKLEEILKEKNIFQRKAMIEKSQRLKLEEELVMIKNRMDNQMRNMRSKIEDEFRA